VAWSAAAGDARLSSSAQRKSNASAMHTLPATSDPSLPSHTATAASSRPPPASRSAIVDCGGSHLSAGLPMQRSDTWCAWSSRSAMCARACTGGAVHDVQ